MNRQKRSNTIKDGATPTPERRKRNGGVTVEVIHRNASGTSLVKRYRAVWECPLDAYRDKGIINETQHKSGMQFREAYYATVNCRAANDRGSPLTEDEQVARLEMVLKAAFRKLSYEQRGPVVDICGHNEFVTDPSRLARLKSGLNQLINLWRVTAQEICDIGVRNER